ncbi:DinB family protein [Sporosarcina beigongshangi]|uniref:DinB family protein n=1 Tax=Sporosarcina beigongshangi TaxID=2782538 RepID=UPI0019399161|nr:DinB family protein [Sporosarcina beigongshangi]
MTVTAVNKSIQTINDSIDAIVSSVEELPEKTIRWNPTEEEWSILQIVSHLNEAVPYWLGEVERVIAQPGSKWGRGLLDVDRLAAVASPDELNVNEEITVLKGHKLQVANRLGTVSEAQLDEENPHRNFEKFGSKPVSFIIDHFIAEHLEKHDGQIQRNLSKLN